MKEKQIVISLLSRAGGVGKTTIAVNMAYELASQYGISTALIDLDPNFSLGSFVGESERTEADTIVSIFGKGFDGKWPLVQGWDCPKLDLLLGHEGMADIVDNLSSRRRAEYCLADLFEKYPLPHEVVILDCPGTQSAITTAAFAASSHILIPVQLEVKIKTAPSLIAWCYETGEELRLSPPPKLLGLIPSNVDKRGGLHRQCLEQLTPIAEELQVHLQEAVPASNEIKNAAATGLPLRKYRPGHSANKVFNQIAAMVVEELDNA